jgi:hypothetical protein
MAQVVEHLLACFRPWVKSVLSQKQNKKESFSCHIKMDSGTCLLKEKL